MKLTEILVEQRDRSSGRDEPIRAGEFGPAYQLTYAVRRSNVARLAEAMISQQLSAISRTEAEDHVGATLQGVRVQATLPTSEARNALTNRSGVLRPASIIMTSQNAPTAGLPAQAASEQNLRSSADAVEFVDNTLKAWLASLHLLAENKPRNVANRALVSGMDDVVVFCAAASTHEDYSRILIEQLLSNADPRGNESDQRAIWILAMRCDAAAPVLPASLREELAGLSDLLFPPRNFGEASQLAALGDMAISHLRWSKALPDELLAPITRCLRLIRLACRFRGLAGL